MSIPQEQIDELKRAFPGVQVGAEGKVPYFFIPGIVLPPHCTPDTVDVLLCPWEQNGYKSRLYYSHAIQRPPPTDAKREIRWKGTQRILERNWHTISWQVEGGTSMRLTQMVLAHLDAFT